MVMRVDQTGHQHAAAAVDDFHGRGDRLFDRFNGGNPSVLDDHPQIIAQGARHPVEQAQIGEGDG